MHAPPTPAEAPAVSDSSNALAYRWLLVCGFPPDVAAAAVMPELFTQEVPVAEKRPGRTAAKPRGNAQIELR